MAKSYASRYENNKESKGDIQKQYIGEGQYNGTNGVNGRVSSSYAITSRIMKQYEII